MSFFFALSHRYAAQVPVGKAVRGRAKKEAGREVGVLSGAFCN